MGSWNSSVFCIENIVDLVCFIILHWLGEYCKLLLKSIPPSLLFHQINKMITKLVTAGN